MNMTPAHLEAVRNARFLAIAAMTISVDQTFKTRKKHWRIAALLSEACDFIENAALTANHSAPVVEE
jgi:hypothetical protein